eukprot:CAMPEP_0113483266 /NCGR_PEP_ID=MMETSP0014_2-20120614/23345_1 /TAXON_ID=2857 /ORGANISM="Nitzschia sp." /LENGTH=632 /DNA_ID=CAMNT_0000376807 /DNA_START=416 /DNA_END=2317 /DNA_ORIENTATION=+ /assembly_acc=CAM_ASM_000159
MTKLSTLTLYSFRASSLLILLISIAIMLLIISSSSDTSNTISLFVNGEEQQEQRTTCEIDGMVFQVDDVVPFQTRCGITSEFPCYCAPNLPRQVYCPYCGHALEDESLLCLGDGQSSTFVGIDGVNQTCTCNVEPGQQYGEPVSNCVEEFGDASLRQFQPSSMCSIELPEGTTQEFEAGQELGEDVLPNRCGADAFPCFCDPSAPRQIVCPYCRFPQSDGTLLCATDGEIVTFIDLDDEPQECSCSIPSDPTAEPIVDCRLDNTNRSGGGGTGTTGGSVNNNNNNSDSGISMPNRPSSPPVNNNDNSNSNSNNSPSGGGTCTVEVEETGEIVMFQRGESYGDYIQTRCGSTSEFPCFCNPDLPMEMECPYCGFVTSSGDLVCGQDGEVVTFEKSMDADNGMTETCLCEIPDEPGAEPIRTCGNGVTAPPTPTPPLVEQVGRCTLTDSATGSEVTFQNGDQLGDLVEGVCGPSSQWPAFCNTDFVTAMVRSASSSELSASRDVNNGIEYPYCIYTDTKSGDPVCARNNKTVRYTNDDGDEMECSCQYLSPGVGGGAQSQCTNLTQQQQQQQQTQQEVPTSSPVLPPYLNNNNNNNYNYNPTSAGSNQYNNRLWSSTSTLVLSTSILGYVLLSS